MDIVLIPGLWLPGAAFDTVAADLTAAGHDPHPLTLPGMEADAAVASLDDQIDAVTAALGSRTLVVGHSAACTLAWLAADRHPDRVAGTVLIGGFPTTDGERYADYFEPVDGQVAFPGWEPFAGADSDDLDEAARAAFADLSTSVPAAVTRAEVRYTDPARFEVPTTLICPEYSAEDARGWVAAGDVPELANVRRIDYVDIDSGHWPMISRPAELAAMIARIADSA